MAELYWEGGNHSHQCTSSSQLRSLLKVTAFNIIHRYNILYETLSIHVYIYISKWYGHLGSHRTRPNISLSLVLPLWFLCGQSAPAEDERTAKLRRATWIKLHAIIHESASVNSSNRLLLPDPSQSSQRLHNSLSVENDCKTTITPRCLIRVIKNAQGGPGEAWQWWKRGCLTVYVFAPVVPWALQSINLWLGWNINTNSMDFQAFISTVPSSFLIFLNCLEVV